MSIVLRRERRQANLREAMLHKRVAYVSGEVAPQRLLAGDEGKATSQLLSHEVPSIPNLVLAGVRDKILHDELSGGNASNCDGSLHDRQDDLQGSYQRPTYSRVKQI